MEFVKSMVAIACYWFFYGLLHSALAAPKVKIWLGKFSGTGRWYRLSYNLIAFTTLIPWFYMLKALPAESIWQWQGNVKLIMDTLAALALLGFFWSLRYYDNLEFLGLRHQHADTMPADLTISPLHQWIRHPWYCFALLIIWTRDMDSNWLISCICITLYFWLGSIFEERKLVREFGARYLFYQQKVPRLLPVPWRHLNKHDLQELEKQN
jgi:protein-S-isoprenylcysteine O-methyltransferase Ste14